MERGRKKCGTIILKKGWNILDLMDENTTKRIKEIRTKYKGNPEIEFLFIELSELELKLTAADILAMTVDVAVRRGTLNARSLINDARLDYGEPWKYEYAPTYILLGYKGKIPEIIEVLAKEQRKS